MTDGLPVLVLMPHTRWGLAYPPLTSWPQVTSRGHYWVSLVSSLHMGHYSVVSRGWWWWHWPLIWGWLSRASTDQKQRPLSPPSRPQITAGQKQNPDLLNCSRGPPNARFFSKFSLKCEISFQTLSFLFHKIHSPNFHPKCTQNFLLGFFDHLKSFYGITTRSMEWEYYAV